MRHHHNTSPNANQNSTSANALETLGAGIVSHGISRRGFLIGTTTIAFGVAFGGTLGSIQRTFADAVDNQKLLSPNAWIQVGTDGWVTIMSPSSEMGQGVMTSMPLLLAEEMDLDWNKIKVTQAPSDPATFGNPLFGGGMSTGGSRSTQGYYEIMRLAGFQARQVMLLSAADHWGVPVEELTTEPHTVEHQASGRRLSYGEIAEFAIVPDELPEASVEQLKPMSKFRLIGQDVPRVDVPGKTTGAAKFGIDTQLDDMLYGVILRAPVQGEAAVSINDGEARQVSGVIDIVELPYGVGVIAESYWAARQGRDKLQVEWSESAAARQYDSDAILAHYSERAQDLGSESVDFIKVGDAASALNQASRTFAAQYTAEHVTHMPMEPLNATARVDGEHIEIWAPTQSPSMAMAAISNGLGFQQENINIHVTLLGGGFGRKVDPDFVVDAASLAKALPGRPIKVLWSREDDVQHGKYRPLTAQHLRVGVDDQGRIKSLHHRIVGESIYARAAPPVFEMTGGKDGPVCDGSDINYSVSNHWVEYLREQRGVDVGFWRAVGPGYTKFALETMIDEIATAFDRDPIEYRMAMLEEQPRARAVLQEVAKMADWARERPGRALGVAYSDHWNVHTAEIAEVSVDRDTGRIRIHEVWAAIDPGIAIQPKNIEAQIESAIVYGISHGLHERITIKGGQVQQTNFHNYRVLRMNETPPITVNVLSTDNKPGGVGEAGLPPISAAIANAVAKLTGTRMRSLPLDQSLLKA